MTHSRIKLFLQFIAVVHIVGGILLPILINTPLIVPYTSLLDQNLNLASDSQTGMGHFWLGLFGPTIASWGILFFYVVTISFKNPDKRGWWAMFLCCMVWAPYDSLLSLRQGIWVNAIVNSISALTILIPLFMVRRSFLNPGHGFSKSETS